MFDHISIAVYNLDRAIAFYDAAFAPLGVRRLWTVADAAGYGYEGADEPFAVKQIPDSVEIGSNNATHVAFRASDRETVKAFHASALLHGGIDEGAPGLHPEYGSGYFAAFVRDPDGNRLEAVLHEAR